MSSKKRFSREAIFVLFLAYTLCSCQDDKLQYFQETGSRFHTIYHITYQSDRLLTSAIDSTMTAFNASLNPFDSNSLIARINRNETVILDSLLTDVLQKAMEVSRQTDGVYDITGAPYFDIWGFGTQKGATREATKDELDSIAQFVGYQKIRIASDTLIKSDSRITINPSSLSKGYVVDLVAQTLEDNGVDNYLVEIGGEIVAKGVNPKGECWNVGINQPLESLSEEAIKEIAYSLPLCNKEGMATSGDYRNYKVINGKKVAHTIDVHTGLPAHQDILSATVVAPTCMEADAWATAFMALGMKRSLALLDALPQLKVCFIYTHPETGVLYSYIKGINLTPID